MNDYQYYDYYIYSILRQNANYSTEINQQYLNHGNNVQNCVSQDIYNSLRDDIQTYMRSSRR